MSGWLFVSDVDDTLLGDDAALARLAAHLSPRPPGLIIAYNSSRPVASLRQSLSENPALPVPDYLIGALGTEIEDGASGEDLAAFDAELSAGWDRALIEAIASSLELRPHPAEFQRPYKVSYDIDGYDTYKELLRRLDEAGHRVTVIHSGRTNLDIIPGPAGKGNAIDFLREQLGVPGDRVVVAGDSGNDLTMFVEPFRGIVVGNADPELKAVTGPSIYHAEATYAAGVLEGLRHWRVL